MAERPIPSAGTAHHELSGISDIVGERLDALYLPEIPMTVPTHAGMLLVGTNDRQADRTTLLCAVAEPEEEIVLQRRDGRPLNVRTVHPEEPANDRVMLHEPVEAVRLIKRQERWHAALETANVRNRLALIGFVSVVATFAAAKQEKLEKFVPIRTGGHEPAAVNYH